jgi:hypothetical protein
VFRFLSFSEWANVWKALPEEQREAYWHPRFGDASGRWEKARPECLLLESDTGQMLYPFLHHPIAGYEEIGTNLFDVQTAYGYGGPLFSGAWTDPEKRVALRGVGDSLARHGVVAEFIRCHTEWTDQQLLSDCGYTVIRVRTNVECALVDRTGGEFINSWAAIGRRNLRIARKAGLRHRVGDSQEDWTNFARLYAITYKRIGMAPSYEFNLDYFRELATLPPDSVALILVEAPHITEPVASGIVLFGKRVAYYHLGASDLTHRRYRPNDFLYWAMAYEALQRGCERIVWGGGLSSDLEDTLFRFKTHFGSVQKPVFIAGRVLDKERYESLCAEWARRNPERVSTIKMFLRYRA